MSNVKLDLKQFKHVRSDKKSTTLRHKDGHELTLAHNALSPEAQTQLKALSGIAKDDQTSDQAKESREQAKSKYGSVTVKESPDKGFGKVIMKAEGGKAEDNPKPDNPNTVAGSEENKEKMRDMKKGAQEGTSLSEGWKNLKHEFGFAEGGQAPKMYADGTDNGGVSPDDQAPMAIPDEARMTVDPDSPAVRQQATNQAMQYLAPNPQAAVPAAVNQEVQNTSDPTSNATAPSVDDVARNEEDKKQPDVNDIDPSRAQIAGFEAEQGANTKIGEEEAKREAEKMKLEQENAQVQNKAIENFKKSFDEIDQERLDHVADIQSGQINPEKYWTGDSITGEGGHSKIMAGIGMLLAGFNPTSAPNAAVNFLQYQMNKNLEAQSKNLDSQHNLLRASLDQFGNVKAATDMTRIYQADAMQHMINANAAKYGGPIAQAQAAKANAVLDREKAQARLSLGIKQAMMRLSNGTNGDNPSDTRAAEATVNMLRQYDPKSAETYANMIVPGVGMAQREVSQADRANIVSQKNVNDLLNQSLQLSQKYGGLGHSLDLIKNPEERVKIKAQAETLHQNIIAAVKQAQHDGVYKESEADFLLKQIGENPVSMLSKFKSEPQVKEMLNIHKQQYDNLLNSYGIRQPQQQNPQAAQQPSTQGQIVVNKKTGQKLQWNGKAWAPVNGQ